MREQIPGMRGNQTIVEREKRSVGEKIDKIVFPCEQYHSASVEEGTVDGGTLEKS